MTGSDSGIPGSREFPDTAWSVIRHARDAESPEYQERLAQLVRMYWRPVYWVIRHGWTRNPDDAKDLTQEFFATVIFDRGLVATYQPARGSFRALLRAAIGSFMKSSVRDAGRLKRGGGARPLSLDEIGADPAELAAGPEGRTPEELFDIAWNHSVMARAIETLEQELAAEGQSDAFAMFRRYDLDGDRAQLSYADLGKELGISGDKVKHTLVRVRARFRDVVTRIVRDYVNGPEELAEELHGFFGG